MAKKSTQNSVAKLQQQLHGKIHSATPVTHQAAQTSQITAAGFKLSTDLPIATSSTLVAADTRYLRHDLTKIMILSLIAISAQLLLYFSLRHGLTIRGF